MSKSFTITMEDELAMAIDGKAKQERRSRSNMIAHLCSIFLSKGAMHPAGNKPTRRKRKPAAAK